MSGWHLGALAAFDVESTGVDVETARIVTAAVAIRGAGENFTRTWLADPGCEIPAEATAVHGITTGQAQAEGRPAGEVVEEIADLLAIELAHGRPLVIYNAAYDLSVLDRETRRHGLEPFAETLRTTGGMIVDPLVIDKAADRYRRGSRKLTAACEHYRVALDGAHDAAADALAAMRVAWWIGMVYPALAAMSPAELHEYQAAARAEQAANFAEYLRRQGKPEVIDPSWPLRELAEAAR